MEPCFKDYPLNESEKSPKQIPYFPPTSSGPCEWAEVTHYEKEGTVQSGFAPKLASPLCFFFVHLPSSFEAYVQFIF